MAESVIQVTEGSGKKIHTWNRTIGANSIEDEVVLMGLPVLASYTVSRAVAASVATANDHLMQIMAGATLNVYVTRIRLYQLALATTAAIGAIQIFRLTTAGTGGTALTPVPDDPSDAAAGATAMMLPTVKGTEGNLMFSGSVGYIQTVPTSGPNPKIFDESFGMATDWSKALRIAPGTTNGLAVKNATAIAAGSVLVVVDFFEANFT